MATRNPLQDMLKRKVAAAKAARGYSWQDIARIMNRCGMPISANHLAAKMSRGSFKATELVLLLRALGIRFLDLCDVEVAGLEEAVREIERGRQA
jgi:hypothetical protein